MWHPLTLDLSALGAQERTSVGGRQLTFSSSPSFASSAVLCFPRRSRCIGRLRWWRIGSGREETRLNSSLPPALPSNWCVFLSLSLSVRRQCGEDVLPSLCYGQTGTIACVGGEGSFLSSSHSSFEEREGRKSYRLTAEDSISYQTALSRTEAFLAVSEDVGLTLPFPLQLLLPFLPLLLPSEGSNSCWVSTPSPSPPSSPLPAFVVMILNLRDTFSTPTLMRNRCII